ncbi:putative L-PSP endoribonuclease family protein [Hyaloscypha variabilis F]|uniref:Putative L-PSP endoribonuclease family protein n=1 Tax=Hyaloscypha variabilis (strain UAMH 11265 / GT02V1 / F) TaxID=1149755 RepID=A0A2J6R923_HYAVF|nr:putative L-PSP endoribonuclease family protein [Hyaloscypha variabilis F]
MVSISPVYTEEACAPIGPYSQAIQAPPFLFISGQIPINPNGVLFEGTITEKTVKCLQNIQAILSAAGTSMEKIVKVTVFLTSMENFAAMNQGYDQAMPHKPARSCVAVKELPKGVPVEIECIAIL